MNVPTTDPGALKVTVPVPWKDGKVTTLRDASGAL